MDMLRMELDYGNAELALLSLFKQIKEEKMSTVVKWRGQQVKSLSFKDVKVGQCFVIDTQGSQGAVYEKVVTNETINDPRPLYFQKEVVTGKLFAPTTSPVRLVEVEILIDEVKPKIY